MCFDISVISLTKHSPSCTGLQQVLNNEQTKTYWFHWYTKENIVDECAGEGNSKVC